MNSASALAIQLGATIYDLEEAELGYAPRFGSAKELVNFAGMVAANVLLSDMPVSHWEALEREYLLDVRELVELEEENVPGGFKARNISGGMLFTESLDDSRIAHGSPESGMVGRAAPCAPGCESWRAARTE